MPQGMVPVCLVSRSDNLKCSKYILYTSKVGAKKDKVVFFIFGDQNAIYHKVDVNI